MTGRGPSATPASQGGPSTGSYAGSWDEAREDAPCRFRRKLARLTLSSGCCLRSCGQHISAVLSPRVCGAASQQPGKHVPFLFPPVTWESEQLKLQRPRHAKLKIKAYCKSLAAHANEDSLQSPRGSRAAGLPRFGAPFPEPQRRSCRAQWRQLPGHPCW